MTFQNRAFPFCRSSFYTYSSDLKAAESMLLSYLPRSRLPALIISKCCNVATSLSSLFTGLAKARENRCKKLIRYQGPTKELRVNEIMKTTVDDVESNMDQK